MTTQTEELTSDTVLDDDAAAPPRQVSWRVVVAAVIIGLFALTYAGLLAWSYSNAKDRSGPAKAAVVATVDDTKIARSTLDDEVATWVANTEYVKQSAAQGQAITDASGKVLPAFVRNRLQTLIADVIVNREFDARGLSVSPAVVANYRQQVASDPVLQAFPKPFVESLIERAARNQAVVNALTPEPSENEIKAAYDQQYGCPSGRDVSHILVKTLPEANAVEAKLASGTDFATLARSTSTDTGSASQGGELGCLRPGVYVPEFEHGAQQAVFGKPTAPIKSQFGYHVILVKPASAPSLDSVRAQIVAALKQNSTAARTAISKEIASASITVDPTVGTWLVVQGQPSIGAPKGEAVGGGTGGPAPFVQNERPKKP